MIGMRGYGQVRKWAGGNSNAVAVELNKLQRAGVEELGLGDPTVGVGHGEDAAG